MTIFIVGQNEARAESGRKTRRTRQNKDELRRPEVNAGMSVCLTNGRAIGFALSGD
jgi:hypothetical protein